MPIICRLIQLSPERATTLVANPVDLSKTVETAKVYSDVYRYWDAIQYLLSQHSPDALGANWLGLGEAVSSEKADTPATRALLPQDVARLNDALKPIEPDDLIPFYKASTLDRKGIYPRHWRRWERTFDPLGQVLEHYWFLKEFVQQRAAAGDALLLYFVFVDDGSD